MAELRLKGGELDGLLLHYLSEGQGPVTVLLHGLGGFAESWRHTIPELGPHGAVSTAPHEGFVTQSREILYNLTVSSEYCWSICRDIR